MLPLLVLPYSSGPIDCQIETSIEKMFKDSIVIARSRSQTHIGSSIISLKVQFEKVLKTVSHAVDHKFTVLTTLHAQRTAQVL